MVAKRLECRVDDGVGRFLVDAGKRVRADAGLRQRIRDVGESHYRDKSAGCSGSIYNNGRIDSKGTLVGLPEKFVSGYRYNGYMELQQGCVMPDGSIKWPCPNG